MTVNNITLQAIREIVDRNCMYDTEKGTLKIKEGKLRGVYKLGLEAAKEMVTCNMLLSGSRII